MKRARLKDQLTRLRLVLGISGLAKCSMFIYEGDREREGTCFVSTLQNSPLLLKDENSSPRQTVTIY